jgi:hypothetical protein
MNEDFTPRLYVGTVVAEKNCQPKELDDYSSETIRTPGIVLIRFNVNREITRIRAYAPQLSVGPDVYIEGYDVGYVSHNVIIKGPQSMDVSCFDCGRSSPE